MNSFDFEDDDFGIGSAADDEEFKLSYVDNVRLQVLEHIGKLTEEIRLNIKMKEQKHFALNSDMLLEEFSLYSQLIDVNEECSEEEQEAIIEELKRRSTEITFKNMNKILSSPEPEEFEEEEEETSKKTDSDSFDW